MERFLTPKQKNKTRSLENTSIEELNAGCDGFDEFMGQRWIYPNNREVRPYQMNAAKMALFSNAMIVLPTGFGKTFIAAVVMYNFYRWYPEGKIIFVAPTRPLVNQQIDECTVVSGIPEKDCIVMTGTTHQDKRRKLWHEKRVIFATPQVIQNDLEAHVAPGQTFKCIVIDEAHRAQGGYAYVEIIKLLQEQNRDAFRVLALSATPGSDIEKVKQVITNLHISDVMFLAENNVHLTLYRKTKNSHAYSAKLSGFHQEIVNKFIEVTQPIFQQLNRAGLIYNCDSIDRASTFVIMQAQSRLSRNEVEGLAGGRKGKLMYYCGAAMSARHLWTLLVVYGLRPFHNRLKKSLQEKQGLKSVLLANPQVDLMLASIEKMFGSDVVIDSSGPPTTHDLLKSHPKLVILQDLLMKHFQNKRDTDQQTRAIVFTKYVESVHDIVQVLRPYEPLLKPVAFVGQKSLSQKKQLATLAQFKEGQYNVLIATCVAEEGLDIGELDLCICYDVSASTISSTQRRGRTGRKRTGEVITLVTEGHEEKQLRKAGADKRQIETQLYDKNLYIRCLYEKAPRMVPHGIEPVCEEQLVFPVREEVEVNGKQNGNKGPKRKRKKKEDDSTCQEELKCSAKKRNGSAKKKLQVDQDFVGETSIMDQLLADTPKKNEIIEGEVMKDDRVDFVDSTDFSDFFEESDSGEKPTDKTEVDSDDGIEWEDHDEFVEALSQTKPQSSLTNQSSFTA